MAGGHDEQTPVGTWNRLAEQATPSPRHRFPAPGHLPTSAAVRTTAGQRLADVVTGWIGAWPFIAIQGLLILLWIAQNTVALRQHWDSYPFILLNLAFSFESAFAAPTIMMSQNQQGERVRANSEIDHAVDLHAEMDIATFTLDWTSCRAATGLLWSNCSGGNWSCLVRSRC